MKTLILAAGNNSRWIERGVKGLPEHKTLAPIGDYRLIDKIIEQVEGEHSIVISNEYLHGQLWAYNTYLIPFSNGPVGSLLSAKPIWSFPMIILLADVIYDPIDMDTIYKCQRDRTTFFGDAGEVYAMYIPHISPSITASMHEIIQSTTGHLRALRKLLRHGKVHIDSLEKEDRKADGNFIFVKGFTMDIDHKAKYLSATKNTKILQHFKKGEKE